MKQAQSATRAAETLLKSDGNAQPILLFIKSILIILPELTFVSSLKYRSRTFGEKITVKQ